MSENQSHRRLRVLLADDHPTNRAVVEVILSLIDVDLVAVEDGALALAAFKVDDFDVVLMDLQMPVMDGLTATRTIREIERVESRGRTPLIVLSANVAPTDRAATADAGADAHIGKPIRADELFTTIGGVMDGEEHADGETWAA